jgi:hypothetical protein
MTSEYRHQSGRRKLQPDLHPAYSLIRNLIKASVFEDGTFEGDPESAATIRAFRAGEKMMLPGLIALMDRALGSPSPDVGAALKALEIEMSSLSSDVELDLFQSLAADFPELGEEAGERIKIAVEISAIAAKTNLLKEIYKLQEEGSQPLTPIEYREWLSKTRDFCAQWLARL